MKYVTNFEEWALEKYHQFKRANELNPEFTYLVSSSARSAVIVNMENGKTSFAKCHMLDKFNGCIGIGVAWARYTGEEIPKQIDIVKISELNAGQKFALSVGAKEEQEFYYIGHNPIIGTSIAVNAISGKCHEFGVNLHVIKI